MDIAPEIAWTDADAVYLSFDIDIVDPGYAPGTAYPEPGGMTPREALKAARMVAREGLTGMDLAEIARPYDHPDVTSQLGARLIMDTLATLVEHGHLGTWLTADQTCIYGPVIHVMTGRIARRQSRHHRHQRSCCRRPRELSGRACDRASALGRTAAAAVVS